eukprot:scaffold88891_cov55-Phaeocystis_antarctica.AAC.6
MAAAAAAKAAEAARAAKAVMPDTVAVQVAKVVTAVVEARAADRGRAAEAALAARAAAKAARAVAFRQRRGGSRTCRFTCTGERAQRDNGRRRVRDANPCRCPDACLRDVHRDIGHSYVHQGCQGRFVAVGVKVVHSPCNRDAKRDEPRALGRRRFGGWRRWRVRLKVGVEAAGPIGGVEAAIGRVDEGARREELATLGPRVIDVPAGERKKAQELAAVSDSRGGRVAPPEAPKRLRRRLRTGCAAILWPAWWHHWAQPQEEGWGGVLRADATPCTRSGVPTCSGSDLYTTPCTAHSCTRHLCTRYSGRRRTGACR